MGASKWFMLVVCMYVKESESEASSWTYTSPTSVKGLLSSCVVIPCSFNYPAKGNGHDLTGIWQNTGGIIFHSREPKRVLKEYQNRIELVGDLTGKNCSMKIDPLQQNDVGPFDFRIEIDNYDKYTYKNKVTISLTSEPNPIQLSVEEDIKEGQTVSASCSLSHFCSVSPPDFKWSHSGEKTHQSQHIANAEWKETSILSFHPTHVDHNKPLQCTVTYKGGKKQERSQILQVKYAPVDVDVQYKVDVKEGETVALTCSSEANPPVSSYEWHNETGAKVFQGNTYRVSNVSRKIGVLYCAAINDEGQNMSKPVQLNVLYAPEVKTESSCTSEGNWVKCECMVDSNPPSTVHFKVGDKILPGATRFKNGSYTVKILLEDIESSKFVQCWADNMQGNASLKLFLTDDGKMLYILIATGAAGILVIILLGVGVYKKCMGTPRHTSGTNMSTMITQRTQQVPQKATERKKKIDDPHDNIYQNENVYGNVEIDWDEQIYANM